MYGAFLNFSYAVFKDGVIDGNRTRFVLLHKQMPIHLASTTMAGPRGI